VYDVIGKRRWFYLFSLLVTVPGLIFIILTVLTGGDVGMKFSIDFTGGSVWEIKFANQEPSPAQVRAVLAGQGVTDATVTATSDGYVLIKTGEPLGLRPAEAAPSPTPIPSPAPSAAPSASPSASPSVGPSGSPQAGASASPGSSAAAGGASPSSAASPTPAVTPTPVPTVAPSPTPIGPGIPTEGKLGEIATALQSEFGPISEVREATTVGPIISSEVTQQAILLIGLGSLGILIWITIRFRDVKMGTSAIIALIHDVIVVVGIFAILGALFGIQVDALFVTAMLTVIGFSVHDTIVVFDRIRENRQRHAGEPFPAIVNHSILQTLGRSINTSMTVVITLVALLLFGPSSINNFILALLIGIVSGTYSSIFVASPILVDWHGWEDRRRQRAVALARATR
jgi:preprotein translocase SecF subunit